MEISDMKQAKPRHFHRISGITGDRVDRFRTALQAPLVRYGAVIMMKRVALLAASVCCG